MTHSRENFFNLLLKTQNMIRFGVIKDVNQEEAKVLVQFFDDCEIWLKTLVLKSGDSFLSFTHSKEEMVLVFCPDGDLTEGVVWGSIPETGCEQGFRIMTDAAAVISAKKGFYLGNGKEDLIDLIVQALKIIANSKTSTLMGVQPSIDSSLRLPQIISKLESLYVSGI